MGEGKGKGVIIASDPPSFIACNARGPEQNEGDR